MTLTRPSAAGLLTSKVRGRAPNGAGENYRNSKTKGGNMARALFIIPGPLRIAGVVITAVLLLSGCASAPTSTVSQPAAADSPSLECNEVFNAGPVR